MKTSDLWNILRRSFNDIQVTEKQMRAVAEMLAPFLNQPIERCPLCEGKGELKEGERGQLIRCPQCKSDRREVNRRVNINSVASRLDGERCIYMYRLEGASASMSGGAWADNRRDRYGKRGRRVTDYPGSQRPD